MDFDLYTPTATTNYIRLLIAIHQVAAPQLIMPRCEGLPDGPCPQNVNNRSVKLTQGDMMLCPKCDAIRFPPKQSNDSDSDLSCRNSTANARTNATSKPKQMKPADANGKSGVINIDDSAHCDNNQGQGNTADTAAVHTVTDDQVSLLRAEVNCQRDMILKLQQQLRSVLSFIGIAEQDIQPPIGNESERINNMPTCQLGVAGQPSWAAAEITANIQHAHSSELQKPRQPITTLQQSLIAAVYVDQSEQKRRESSLIVSGLQENEAQTDKLIFANLCNEEFNVQPDIVTTKRLGRAQPTKIRPLLVVTRKTDQAQHLIAAAKQLRKSLNPTVRDNVYINRNLTKAEAEAAYCVRVQRRQAAEHRAGNRGTRLGADNLSNEQSDTDVSRSLLNIAHNPNGFVPPPSTSDSRASVSSGPVLPTITVPPAADQSRQQGRRD